MRMLEILFSVSFKIFKQSEKKKPRTLSSMPSSFILDQISNNLWGQKGTGNQDRITELLPLMSGDIWTQAILR